MMDIAEGVADLAKRVEVAKNMAQTEEATKNATVLPFLRLLGFDVFDIRQVIPEYVADVGVKKGEKVDYALKNGDNITALIEVKPINTDLSSAQYTQLYRYFSVTDARIGILTNGRQYWFFSDLDDANKMDRRPFFVFDLESYDDSDVRELSKFHRERFDIDVVLSSAETMKYVHAAAIYLSSQLREPDEDFVKLIGRQIYEGNMTKSVVEQLRAPVRSAFNQIIRDRIRERIQAAFDSDQSDHSNGSAVGSAEEDASTAKDGIVTTEEEWEGFYIVRAIAAEVLEDVERIVIRDAKSYCAILFDDNNRRPVCRLRFNSKSVKFIGLFDDSKKENKHDISKPNDIYKFKDEIRRTISRYMSS